TTERVAWTSVTSEQDSCFREGDEPAGPGSTHPTKFSGVPSPLAKAYSLSALRIYAAHLRRGMGERVITALTGTAGTGRLAPGPPPPGTPVVRPAARTARCTERFAGVQRPPDRNPRRGSAERPCAWRSRRRRSTRGRVERLCAALRRLQRALRLARC